MKKIGIIGAMDIEISILKEEMKQNGTLVEEKSANLVFYSGKIFGTEVVLVKSGVGKVNAALCAQLLILKFNVSAVINTGIAGAMAKELTVFDMVASTDALYHDMDATAFGYKITQIPQMEQSDFESDKNLCELAVKAFSETDFSKEHKIIKGRVASGDQFIADKETKANIEKSCSPACVEMEGAAIAHACYLNKTPYLILRCISDNADESYESTYSFNEQTAAEESSSVLLKMLSYENL